MKNIPVLSFIFTIYIFIIFSACQIDNRPLDVQLEEAMTEELKENNIRGASAAVILPDESIHRIVAGFSHDSVAIDPDMLFAIGSITKNMVAALVLRLTEEGVLDLSDSLHEWLPSYAHVDSTITIRQLLNHTSGLYMFWDNDSIWEDLKKYRGRIFTPEMVLGYLKDPYFAPGKNFRYSNTNYLLLAMIITRATGSSLSREFRDRFWEPLDIRNTFLSVEEDIPPRLAHVWGDHFENDGSNRDLTYLPRNSHESITYGSSGLFMTAEDLAKWSYKLFQGKVLSDTSLNQMLHFHMGGYGLGVGYFRSILGGGRQAVGHMGGNIGTTSAMIYSRKHKISLAVMINSYDVKIISSLSDRLGKIVLKSL